MTKTSFFKNKKILVQMIRDEVKFTIKNMIDNGIDEDFIDEMFMNGVFSYMKDNETVWVNWTPSSWNNQNSMKNIQTFFNEDDGEYVDFYKMNKDCLNDSSKKYTLILDNWIINHSESEDASCGITHIISNDEIHEIYINWQMSGVLVDCTDMITLKTFIRNIVDSVRRMYHFDDDFEALDFIYFDVYGKDVPLKDLLKMVQKNRKKD